MELPALVSTNISLENTNQVLLIPDQANIKEWYSQQLKINPETPFPFWAKIWEAAIAMGIFIERDAEMFAKKYVLELAAGLGLPSITVAKYAESVVCSDYAPIAMEVVKASINYLAIENITCECINWNEPFTTNADIVLMSDVNYDATQFDSLYTLFSRLLAQGCTIFLSTPQRLLAKPFIELIAHWCIQQEEIIVFYNNANTPVTIFILEGKRERGKEGKRERGKEGKRERGKEGKRERGKEGKRETQLNNPQI